MNPTTRAKVLLQVSELSVSAPSDHGRREIIQKVSFSVRPEEVLVLLGESGSGKTILSRSLTNLFPVTSTLSIQGSVMFDGRQLLCLGESELAFVRRHKIRYVFQEPMQSLNPMARVRTQMNHAASAVTADDDSLVGFLASMGLENSREILDSYPHQLSTGVAQRVCIAMALLSSPELLIADEPTSSVDASLRYKLLDLLVSAKQNRGLSLLLITHDLDVARLYGDRIIVMYGGRVIESANREAFFKAPLHPYSRLLVDSQQAIDNLIAPSVIQPAQSLNNTLPRNGCRFHPACPKAESKCSEQEPSLEHVLEEREVRCFYWK